MDRRKAGDFLSGLLSKAREVDDAYTARINKMYEGSNPAVRTAAVLAGGGHPSLRKGEVEHLVYGPETRMQRGARNAMEYALPAASAVPKYVLPAAGVTLAGKGLMDLAAAFGGPADQQQPGQISLGQSAGAALTSGGSVALGMEVMNASRDELTQASISPRNRAAIAIGTGLGGGLLNAALQ
jgi:hypothetical protein